MWASERRWELEKVFSLESSARHCRHTVPACKGAWTVCDSTGQVKERVKQEGKRVDDKTANAPFPLLPLSRPRVGSALRSHPVGPNAGARYRERPESPKYQPRTSSGNTNHHKIHRAKSIPETMNRCRAQPHPFLQQHHLCQDEAPFSHCLMKKQTTAYAELPKYINPSAN